MDQRIIDVTLDVTTELLGFLFPNSNPGHVCIGDNHFAVSDGVNSSGYGIRMEADHVLEFEISRGMNDPSND